MLPRLIRLWFLMYWLIPTVNRMNTCNGSFAYCVSLYLIETMHATSRCLAAADCRAMQSQGRHCVCEEKKPSGSSAEDDKLSKRRDARHIKELFLEALAWSRGRWATARLLSHDCCHLCGPNKSLNPQTASGPAFNLRWADTLTRSGRRQQTLTLAESQSQFGFVS